MFRYQILIEYVGTNFRGWQIQKKGKTIQRLIQQKISKILKEKIILIGSGRTDTGVHAIGQSAHFDCKSEIENLDKFLKSINYFLNKDLITILKIKKRSSYFHSRFSAKMRIYKYIIINRIGGPVLDKERGWHVTNNLNLPMMKKAAKKLVGTKDFSTFRASSCRAKTPIKTMKLVKVKSRNNKIEIEFQSKSFLQQQVRSMVGCLKYVGEKKWSVKKFNTIMNSLTSTFNFKYTSPFDFSSGYFRATKEGKGEIPPQTIGQSWFRDPGQIGGQLYVDIDLNYKFSDHLNTSFSIKNLLQTGGPTMPLTPKIPRSFAIEFGYKFTVSSKNSLSLKTAVPRIRLDTPRSINNFTFSIVLMPPPI